MKTRTIAFFGILGTALLTGILVAASSPSTPPPVAPPTPATSAPDSRRDEFQARMAEKLGLNADQQKKISELRAAQRAELQTLRNNKDLAPDARREKARAIVDNYRTQMRAVLTPDQAKKADELREHMARRGWGAGRFAQGPGGPGGAQGPAMQPPPPNPAAILAMGERIKDRIAEKLQLTNEQRDKLEHLGRDYRAQQRDLAKKHREEMQAVLTPEQQQKIEEWKQHARPGMGPRSGPGGRHLPFLSMDDEPEGMMMAGPDFEPGDMPEELSDNPPPLPDEI